MDISAPVPSGAYRRHSLISPCSSISPPAFSQPRLSQGGAHGAVVA
jgi:hypothetical protein